MSLRGFRAGLLENQAHTHPEHPDPSLRGRTYAIPFAQVWASVVELAQGGLRGWTTNLANEDMGMVQAESRALIQRSISDVEIRISLDENALTRIDVSSVSRVRRGDLGANARCIRAFFRAVDKRVGAGPGKILDPTASLFRAGLLLSVFLIGCGPGEGPPPEAGVIETGSQSLDRNFPTRSYERNIVFLTFPGDSAILVPWSFFARTGSAGVEREIRGWLARSDTWDPFFSVAWEGPPNSAPWRILPQGPVRLVVGLGDALETIIFQDGSRYLELKFENLLVEWSGQRAQTYRIHQGTLVLADRIVEGDVLDMTRAWASEDEGPGDWGILLSGDSLHVVLEDQAREPGQDGGSFSVWARVEFIERQWQQVRLSWVDARPFEPARRDVPMSWEIESEGGDLGGTITAVAPFLEVGEGEGPMLPVDALFQVTGTLTLAGAEFPVRGLFRHKQR